MEIYESEKGGLNLGLIGDVMLSRRLTPFREPEYLALKELLAGTDATFANLETTVRRRDEGYPNFTQGTPMWTDPALLDDLRWLGVDFVSCANNHATDWGVGGVEATIAHLNQARIPFAGIGNHLGEAVAPGYFDSPAGRIGLVAATGFFRPWNRAAAQRDNAPGRPGINPLAFTSAYEVSEETFSRLQEVAAELGLDRAKRRAKSQFFAPGEVAADAEGSLTMFGQELYRGSAVSLSTRANAADLEANLRAIREARRQSDWVVVSIHFHDFGGATALTAERDVDMTEPADFARDFARRAIDAGADIVVGHGPHLTLGVEVYKGKPILYSLGNAVFQNDTIEVVPDDSYRRFGLGADATPADFLDVRTDNDRKGFPATAEYWEGLAAVCRFEQGRPVQVKFHPLDLGYGRPRAQRGRPVLARGEVAKQILTRLQRLSSGHGTRVSLEGGSAVVDCA